MYVEPPQLMECGAQDSEWKHEFGNGLCWACDGPEGRRPSKERTIMRLTRDQQTAIRSAIVETFGEGADVWLFGSRADDSKRGGDIDLLVCPGPDARDQIFSRRIRLLTRLERMLGERKIDVVIEMPQDSRPIVAVAHATGVKLG